MLVKIGRNGQFPTVCFMVVIMVMMVMGDDDDNDAAEGDGNVDNTVDDNTS